MSVYNDKITVFSRGFNDFIDITSKIDTLITKANAQEGIVNIYPLSSCISILLAADEPGICEDISDSMELLAPVNKLYKHDTLWHNGNGFSHIKAAFLKSNLTIGIKDMKLMLSENQRIIAADFDISAGEKEIAVNVVY